MSPRKKTTQDMWPDETPEEILARITDPAERAVIEKFMRGDIEPKRKEKLGGPDIVGKDRRKFRRPAIPQQRGHLSREEATEVAKLAYEERRERDEKLIAAGFKPPWQRGRWRK